MHKATQQDPVTRQVYVGLLGGTLFQRKKFSASVMFGSPLKA